MSANQSHLGVGFRAVLSLGEVRLAFPFNHKSNFCVLSLNQTRIFVGSSIMFSPNMEEADKEMVSCSDGPIMLLMH